MFISRLLFIRPPNDSRKVFRLISVFNFYFFISFQHTSNLGCLQSVSHGFGHRLNLTFR